MCTAISYKNGDHYFGRNLDLECRFSESVIITPRRFPFCFRSCNCLESHYAMIGIGSVVDKYPLYYEATNEFGLSIAALNFPNNAEYFPPQNGMLNLAPYELIPWILGQYKTIQELRKALANLNIISAPFSSKLPLSPLHWMISDPLESVVLESTAAGAVIYDNPIRVLTNNPPFPFHIQNLSNYLNLTPYEPKNLFAPFCDVRAYSRGLGGCGLPGDLSSASRFIRAAFALHNSAADMTENGNVNQFFHILDFVSQPSGCVRLGNQYEITLYSSCCNTSKGIFYYKTYNNSSITSVYMSHHDLNTVHLKSYPLRQQSEFYSEN